MAILRGEISRGVTIHVANGRVCFVLQKNLHDLYLPLSRRVHERRKPLAGVDRVDFGTCLDSLPDRFNLSI